MKYISVIGAGQLGSRHLQGLGRINQDISIVVIDPNPDSLELSRQRFEEMPLNPHIQEISYQSAPEQLKHNLDLAIIATNADVRRQVIEGLLSKVQVKNLILEKVVFQSIEDFEKAILLLDEGKIKAWINCPRRMVSFFKNLRKETIKAKSLRMSVKGSNWGLASNTIHMLDLLAFVSGQTDFTIDVSKLDYKVYKTKRKSYIEMGGRILAKTDRGDVLDLVDDRTQKNSFQMSIEYKGKQFDIDQQLGLVRNRLNGVEKINESPFQIPLQSEITAGVTERILDSGNSDLTTLKESFLLHRPMLEAFNQHLSSLLKKHITVCPIT